MVEENVAEQSDAEAEAEANEDAGAQDKSVDDLIAEFGQDEADTTESEQRTSSSDDDTGERGGDPLYQYVASKDIREAARDIRSDVIDPDFMTDQDIIDEMDRLAKRNPKILNAFNNRIYDQEAWEKAQGTLKEAIQRNYHDRVERQRKKLLSEKLTSDREAARAAVRGASTSAPETSQDIPSHEELMKMSDSEYRNALKRMASTG